MQTRIYILVVCNLFLSFSSISQCPDKTLLYQRLNELRVTAPKPAVQLTELLPKLDSINRCAIKYDSVHAMLLRRIGTLYFAESDFVSAKRYYLEYINSRSKNRSASALKETELIGGYYWLSVMYDSLNMISEKFNALDSSAAIASRTNSTNRANLASIYQKVLYYFDIGDYYRSIDYAERCETLAGNYAELTNSDEKSAAIGFTKSSLLWRVKALLELKKYEAAEQLLTNKLDEYKRTDMRKYLGTIYGQLGELEEQKGNFEKAFYFFSRELKFYQEAGDDFSSKQTLNLIGYHIYFSHYRNYDRAMENYRAALKYVNRNQFHKQVDVFESLNIFSNIAKVYARKEMYDSAYFYFQRAFDQIKPGINEWGILQISSGEIQNYKKIFYLTGLLIDKADAYQHEFVSTNNRKALQEAIRMYKAADLFLDKVKVEQSDMESKLFWRKDSRRLYENAIEACYKINDMAGAFYFFEKSRAVLLNDQLNRQRWWGEDDISFQTQKRKKLQQLERELRTADPKSDQYENLQQQIFHKKLEMDSLEKLIKQRMPLYYQSFLDSSKVSLSDVQKNVLSDHQALVEIFTGDSAVYIIIITATKNQINKVVKKDFDRLTNDYIQYISNHALLNQHFGDFVKTSHQLYELMFAGITLPKGRVIISPQGRYFPFEALVIKEHSKTPDYFLSHYAVSYTYSARYLLNHFESTGAGKAKNFIGIAPVQYRPVFSMATLSGSDISLNRISSLFGEINNLVKQDASRNSFLQQFPSYKIVQLYTHASDSSDNNEPVIYFADSSLYLSELIPDKKPFTQLVVLSACETGNGIEYQGEGVFSFNRGFAALGIPSSVMNLWSVDNESTYKLNELFYKYLAKGLPLDIAMQKAKIDFMKNGSQRNALPYYWAAPVLAGKSDAIDYTKPFQWGYIVYPLLIIGLIYLVWIFKRRMKLTAPVRVSRTGISD